jgi:glutamyl/glutaminyl-tRNA synthetase
MPMILGSDRSKLSKRHGAFAVTDYKQMGFFPEALNNYMALLGWSPGNDIEFMSMDDMISLFDISKVQLSPAVFDFDKLKWFNGQHLRKEKLLVDYSFHFRAQR